MLRVCHKEDIHDSSNMCHKHFEASPAVFRDPSHAVQGHHFQPWLLSMTFPSRHHDHDVGPLNYLPTYHPRRS